MSKQTKREEEQKVLAQMEEAMQEKKAENTENGKKEGVKEEKKSRSSFYSSAEPETIHCRRCKTLMENGVCPTCGFKMYVPMSEEKRKKIQLITTAIGFAVFIVIFLIIQFAKN